MKIHQHNAGYMAKIAVMPIYGKNTLNIFFQRTIGLISMELCLKHQRPKPFIFCSNYDPGLTLTYFMARVNFATKAFIWESVTLLDSLEIIASCDLDFG